MHAPHTLHALCLIHALLAATSLPELHHSFYAEYSRLSHLDGAPTEAVGSGSPGTPTTTTNYAECPTAVAALDSAFVSTQNGLHHSKTDIKVQTKPRPACDRSYFSLRPFHPPSASPFPHVKHVYFAPALAPSASPACAEACVRACVL